MDIKKELDGIINDPLLEISEKERELFDMPADMKKAAAKRTQPDHYAQSKICEDFANYQDGFKQVHQDLQTGKRNLVKTSKTDSMIKGNYYFVDGQMLLLQSIGEYVQAANGMKDGRTRCIFENGTETDILLQTLRKNVMANGYAITATQKEIDGSMFNSSSLDDKDKVTGFIYILSSLSAQPNIAGQADLYKIGFTVNSVEKRIANAVNDPTYLMAPVKIVATYKIVNLNSHVFETMIHQVLDGVQMQMTVTDAAGKVCHPKEWYVVPFPVIETIIKKILDGTITQYSYNPQVKCLEKTVVKSVSTFDTSGMKVLSLNIKKVYFDEIMKGKKKIEYRELKQTTIKKYTYLDESDGKRYLRRYDALHLYVGYHKDRENALVEVTDITYNEGIVEYHLGKILEHIGEPN